MRIEDNLRLKDLQEAFEHRFPYLRIEFYAGPHDAGKGSPEETRLDVEATVGSVRDGKKSGEIVLDETLTTAEFEQWLREEYGLNVQVFRKSYGKWLQTWATDTWSLKEQNRRGEIMGDKGVTIV